MKQDKCLWRALGLAIWLVFIASSVWAVETDVSSTVQVNRGRPYYDYAAQQTYTDLSLQNTSEQTYYTPVKLVIDSVTSPDVTVANADGITEDGKPYFDYSASLGDGVFAAAETSTAKTVRFANPSRLRFNFTTRVLADATPPNQPPVANAGVLQRVVTGSVVHLNGNGSYDPEGNEVTYEWSLTSVPGGSGATLSDPTSATSSFVADVVGDYEVQLVVSDGDVASVPATATIIVKDTIGPEGGYLSTADGVELTVPAGALAEETAITVEYHATSETLPGPMIDRIAGGVTLKPDGLVFATPINLVIPLIELLEAGKDYPLYLYREDRNGWQQTDSMATVAEDRKHAYASITHFSTFVVQYADYQFFNGVMDSINDFLDPYAPYNQVLQGVLSAYPLHSKQLLKFDWRFDGKIKTSFPSWYPQGIVPPLLVQPPGYHCYEVTAVDVVLAYAIADQEGEEVRNGDKTIIPEDVLYDLDSPQEPGDLMYVFTVERDVAGKLDGQQQQVAAATIDATIRWRAVPPDMTIFLGDYSIGLGQSTDVEVRLSCDGKPFDEQEIDLTVLNPAIGTIDPVVDKTDAAGMVYTTFTGSISNPGIATLQSDYECCVGTDHPEMVTETANVDVGSYLDILPKQKILLKDESVTLGATLYDPEHEVIPRDEFIWNNSNTGIASINPKSGTTVVSATAIAEHGTATISATDEETNVSGKAVLDIGATVDITPASLCFDIDKPEQLTAQLTWEITDAAGTPFDKYPLQWTSSNPAVAVVTDLGLVRAIGVGQAILVGQINYPGGGVYKDEVLVSVHDSAMGFQGCGKHWHGLKKIASKGTFSDIAMNKQGDAAVIMTHYRKDQPDVVSVRRFVRGEGWQPLELLDDQEELVPLGPAGAHSHATRVVIDDAGNVTAVWLVQEYGSVHYYIRSKRYETGSGWQPMETIADIPAYHGAYHFLWHLIMTMSIDRTNGLVTVEWSELNPVDQFAVDNTSRIMVREYKPGVGWTSAYQISATTNPLDTICAVENIAGNNRGDRMIAWVEFTHDQEGSLLSTLKVKHYTHAFGWEDEQILKGPSVSAYVSSAGRVKLLMGEAGGVNLIYEDDYYISGPRWLIKHFDPTRGWGPFVESNTAATYEWGSYGGQMTNDAAGGFWITGFSSYTELYIQHYRYDAVNNIVTFDSQFNIPLNVSVSLFGFDFDPGLVSDGNGNVITTYSVVPDLPGSILDFSMIETWAWHYSPIHGWYDPISLGKGFCASGLAMHPGGRAIAILQGDFHDSDIGGNFGDAYAIRFDGGGSESP